MLSIELLKADEMPLDLLAESFREFYERDPWNEFLRCPRCNAADDFGSVGRYENPLLQDCPVCGTSLEQYWSDERVTSYFSTAAAKPNFGGVVGKNSKGEIVAWAWAYAASCVSELIDLPQAASAAYIDVIGILPEYRSDKLQVFVEGHALTQATYGYPYFVTRTHSDAKYVQEAISLFGYRFLRVSDDPEREFWIYDPDGLTD